MLPNNLDHIKSLVPLDILMCMLNQFCIWIIRSSFSFSKFAFAATQKEVSLSSGGTKVTSQAMRGPHSSRIGSDRFGQNPKHLLLEIWNLRVILFQGIHQDLENHTALGFLCIQNQFKPETGLHRSISVCFLKE